MPCGFVTRRGRSVLNVCFFSLNEKAACACVVPAFFSFSLSKYCCYNFLTLGSSFFGLSFFFLFFYLEAIWGLFLCGIGKNLFYFLK